MFLDGRGRLGVHGEVAAGYECPSIMEGGVVTAAEQDEVIESGVAASQPVNDVMASHKIAGRSQPRNRQ